jgi:hypothetical protein
MLPPFLPQSLPTTRSCAPFVALMSDGAVVTGEDHAIRIGDRRVVVPAGVVTATVVGGQVWVVTRGGALRRYGVDGSAVGAPLAIGDLVSDVTIVATSRGPRAALIESEHWCALIRERDDGTCSVEVLGAGTADRRILIGTRTGERAHHAAIRIGRMELPIPADLVHARVGASGTILDGSTLLVELVSRANTTVVLYSLRNGTPSTRIRIGESRVVAIAERANIAVLARGSHVALLDMRAGRCTAERILTSSVVACAIEDNGASLTLLDAAGHTIRLGRALTDLDGAAQDAGDFTRASDDVPVRQEAESAPVEPCASEVCEPVALEAVETSSDESIGALGRVEHLHALGAPRAQSLSNEALVAYRAAAHAWIEAICVVAVAAKRADASVLASAREQERVAGERFAEWNRRGAPHVELACDLDLSPLAATLLLVIGAPQIWCELARDYAAVSGGDASRPLVDMVLVATLLGAGIDEQSELARELDADAPLVRSGAVVIGAGVRPYAALSVNAVVARRLAGLTIESRASELVDFANFVGPRAEVVALADALVEARSTPARIALRGKPGSGRRTVAAILAARAGRDVEVVASSASDLAQRLREVALRGHVPVVDLEELPADDEARRAAVRLVLGEHVGPLFVRAERDTDLPVTPTETVDFPMLSETERAACWRLHLGDEACADALAERYAIGAGAIARAAAATDPIAALRASRGRRIARMAERVERLASWENLVVTPDVDDALHELVARVRFRRTVLETWGMGDVATTARGVTALFQGGPGTGKTMAAGVIAKALGYELWRVDLSKVVSKWIGETERNLGMLFDAAEEGEIVLLFDEADALFTKRTEVKSSNDKHANAATNYLLQRLDSFTGIAILTTNFGTAIDAAFRRRLAVHIEFPFPDEQERLRLWRAHLPKSLPTRGDLQLQQIAETYQLSGGYIRNAALRAAYLAAGRAASPAITADDLRRAIALEKERIGKLGNGRIE